MAVEAHREEQYAAGIEVTADAGWTIDEVAIAAKVCLQELARSMTRPEEAELGRSMTLAGRGGADVDEPAFLVA